MERPDVFPDEIESLAQRVIETAAARGRTVATAESCTGGLVAGALTAVAGSSAVLDRGFVTYSNAAKTALLGVPAGIIEAHGAVSELTARAMAGGARAKASVDAAVAITGVAGPGGGSPDKPVGLVHFGSDGPLGEVHAVRRFGDLGREGVRLAAVRTALEMLLAQVEA